MNEVAKIEQTQPEQSAPILAIISRAASDPSCDIDKLERLMQMHERMQAKDSEREFNVGMTDAQSKMTRVSADGNNPQTRSKYATYAALDRALRPIYSDCGFSLSFDTGDTAAESCIRVLCYVSHSSGHTRTYHVDMPADGKGAKGGDVMTKTHATGAAMSYGMRYLLKMIFNVAIGEDDTDGNEPPPRIDDKERARRDDWLGKIKGAADSTELAKVKAECCKAYGMPDQVPRPLKLAFVDRAKAFS